MFIQLASLDLQIQDTVPTSNSSMQHLNLRCCHLNKLAVQVPYSAGQANRVPSNTPNAFPDKCNAYKNTN